MNRQERIDKLNQALDCLRFAEVYLLAIEIDEEDFFLSRDSFQMKYEVKKVRTEMEDLFRRSKKFIDSNMNWVPADSK
jgi:hypothetical protein